ncbi:MAG: hypothetical protein U0800_01620 [Isosphaeraceae bacterium]
MSQSNATPELPRARPIGWPRSLVPALIVWLALIPLSIKPRHSGNVWSRYMTIESIVERGTMAIDRSPLLGPSGSPDIVKWKGRTYSDKPPSLSALSSPVYLALFASGWKMAGSPHQFLRVNLVMVSSVIGLGTFLALVALRRMLQIVPVPKFGADLATLAAGFGTPLLTYGVTFNNHSVAAGLLTAAFAMVLLERPGQRRLPARRAVAGFSSGLAAAIDLPAGGVLIAGLGLWLIARAKRPPWAFAVAACIPLMSHAALQLASTGSPFPVEMTPDRFEYDNSYWNTEEGTFRETIPRWLWGVEMLVGPQGWLTITPVLALGLVGIGWIAARRGDPLRAPALVAGGMIGVRVLYYAFGVRRTDFSGLSYGTRHLLAVTPLAWFFAIAALGRWQFRGLWVASGIFWAVGFIYAWHGMLDPWSRVERRTEPALIFLQKAVLYPYTSYRR